RTGDLGRYEEEGTRRRLQERRSGMASRRSAAGRSGARRGDLMFVVEMPPNFDRAVDRGESPGVLIDADATDPTAIGNAVAALGQAVASLNDLPPIRQIQP